MTDIDKFQIAVGLDGSERSWKAFHEALELSRLKAAVLHLVSVQESVDPSYSASEVLASEQTAHEKLEKVHQRAREQAKASGVTAVGAILTGHTVNAMVEYIKQNNIKLLLLGDIGHLSIWGALLGTSAEKIVRNAPCSVMIVR